MIIFSDVEVDPNKGHMHHLERLRALQAKAGMVSDSASNSQPRTPIIDNRTLADSIEDSSKHNIDPKFDVSFYCNIVSYFLWLPLFISSSLYIFFDFSVTDATFTDYSKTTAHGSAKTKTSANQKCKQIKVLNSSQRGLLHHFRGEKYSLNHGPISHSLLAHNISYFVKKEKKTFPNTFYLFIISSILYDFLC